jgi:hypothetical protein
MTDTEKRAEREREAGGASDTKWRTKDSRVLWMGEILAAPPTHAFGCALVPFSLLFSLFFLSALYFLSTTLFLSKRYETEC